jgi:16S rRNA (cytidine1402-2'-O)-methyltransferase
MIKKYFMLNVPVVFYESPRRLLNTMKLMKDTPDGCTAFIFKELTKMYEGIIYGTICEVIDKLEHSNIKGEYTVIIDCKGHKAGAGETAHDKKSLIKIASAMTGLDKREIYKRLFRKGG